VLLDLYVREPALHAYHPALLHGDLSPDHILDDATADRLTGIIDFGDACLGDPA
jgi:aminoglycoside 2''-phosphotransferase